MEKEIREYLNVLYIEDNNIEIIKNVSDYLRSKDSNFINKNKKIVAELFYQIICAYQRCFGDYIPDDDGKSIIALFLHISQLSSGLPDEYAEDDSNLTTIWFLNELYRKANNRSKIDEERLQKCINVLIEGLNDIHIIFKIEVDGDKIFPINHIISDVIKSKKFMDVRNITPEHIHMFQLAVELFDNQDDKEILEKLKQEDECNLQFLNYMDGWHEILDTVDYLNYQKNGVMIFYNTQKQSALIRHEKKSYFAIKAEQLHLPIFEERNSRGEVIGYFVIIDLKEAEPVDFSIIMKDEALELLKLVFNDRLYNIFQEKSIYEKQGKYYPVNPFSINDKYIVKGYMNRPGSFYPKEDIKKVIRRYRMHSMCSDAIDQVTFGLCLDLLEHFNVGVEALKIDELSGNTWMQNEVIYNWVHASPDSKSALKYILEKICTELEYCKSDREFAKHKIITQDVLPYACDFSWMYDLLGFPTCSYSMFKGIIDEDAEGNIVLVLDNRNLIEGKSDEQFFVVNINDLDFIKELSSDDQEDYIKMGSEHFLFLNVTNSRWEGNVEDEHIYECLIRAEKLLSKNSLPSTIKKVVTNSQIHEIESYMHLHIDALMSVGEEHPLFADFDSMARYRLLHNLIWNKIYTEDRWHIFYRIIHQHQKLTFSDIKKDDIFKRLEHNTLYVPKDNTRADGTLCRTYYDYMQPAGKRDKSNPYDSRITIDSEGRYLLKGELVKKIVFLFDNICSGSGTCDAVAFYLNKEELVVTEEREWTETKKINFRNEQQRYFLEDRQISVSDIILKNKITKIAVHSFYGTSQGIEKVKHLLAECGYDNKEVDFEHEILHYYSQVKEDAITIWPKLKEQPDFCLVIREYNQTKKNVFPMEMITDANKAICLFVLKK